MREIAVGSQAEGCAADDELGHLYVAEEDVGLWKYGAEPDAGETRTAVDSVEKGNLTAEETRLLSALLYDLRLRFVGVRK